jgi:hypothetical protein
VVEYRLENADPVFQEMIPTILDDLMKQFPVELYDAKSTDTSMGATLPGGIIKLNAYWFSGDPDRLNDAAKRDLIVEANGVPILWHGPMIEEPEHLLVHEFGHVVEQVHPLKCNDWALRRFVSATKDPVIAPSGYGLSHPAEYFAEAFALSVLGLATEEEEHDMNRLLAGLVEI